MIYVSDIILPRKVSMLLRLLPSAHRVFFFAFNVHEFRNCFIDFCWLGVLNSIFVAIFYFWNSVNVVKLETIRGTVHVA